MALSLVSGPAQLGSNWPRPKPRSWPLPDNWSGFAKKWARLTQERPAAAAVVERLVDDLLAGDSPPRPIGW
jgi:hypothetical protein